MTLSRAAVGQQMVPIVTRNVTTGRQTMSAALNPSGDRHAMQRSGMGSMNESTGASVAPSEKQEFVSAWPILQGNMFIQELMLPNKKTITAYKQIGDLLHTSFLE